MRQAYMLRRSLVCGSEPSLRARGGEPSLRARELALEIRRGEIGPVLSLRTLLPDCNASDLQEVLTALGDAGNSVHLLSIGCSSALATSPSLASQLVQVLRKGLIWACDFGELYFRWDVLERIINGLEGPGPEKRLLSNLAFVFIDRGCGIDAEHVAKLKSLTRRRRMLDKQLPSRQVGRTHAPWLDVPRVFGMVMHSKNLTKCFWRPYQEPDFWRRAGFNCNSARKPTAAPGRWVNPALRRLTATLHRGNLDPVSLQKAFPPGPVGEQRSRALLESSLNRKLPRALLPQWVLPGKRATSQSQLQPKLREGLLKRRRQQLDESKPGVLKQLDESQLVVLDD